MIAMKAILTMVLAAVVGVMTCGVSHAGEATVKEKFVFNATFDKMVEVMTEHEEDIMSETMGNARVVEEDGDLVTVEVNLPGRRSFRVTVRILADINFKKKRAKYKSELVKTDGFVTKQFTEVRARERDGKMYVDVTYHATVPEIGDNLIRLELRRSMMKFVRVINGYLR